MTIPLVLLHPLGVNPKFFDPVRDQLPDSITPELPGPAGATVEYFAGTVEAALAGHQQVDVVGISLGGLVGQVLAARRPDLVRRLVVADAVAVYPEAMRAMWRDRAAGVRRNGLDFVVAPTEALWFTDAAPPEARERVREMLLAGDPDSYARTCEALAAADTTALAPSITCPTLVACGKDDARPFREAVDWFAANLPDASVAWLPGKHATAYEHPRAFAGAVTRFLR